MVVVAGVKPRQPHGDVAAERRLMLPISHPRKQRRHDRGGVARLDVPRSSVAPAAPPTRPMLRTWDLGAVRSEKLEQARSVGDRGQWEQRVGAERLHIGLIQILSLQRRDVRCSGLAAGSSRATAGSTFWFRTSRITTCGSAAAHDA